jgi:hypothetical protein
VSSYFVGCIPNHGPRVCICICRPRVWFLKQKSVP